jgi:hypothetical protein
MPDESPRLRSQPNWTTIALIAGLVLLLLLVAYFATNRNSDQDKLTGNEMAGSSASTTPEKACASQATYNLIKRELFRRAAQLRGSDQAAYDKLSAVAVLRMENPVMESEEGASGGVNCSGSLSLDLPPGIAAVGGRKTLMSDVDYTVQPAADGSGTVVLLRNADSVIAPLATLARVGQAPAPAATPVITGDAAPQSDQPAQPTGQTGAPAPQSSPAPPRTATARPSFDCSKARTKGEIAVCSDSGLAALDVNMAAQYRRAISSASPQQQAILQSTRDRFLGYRDRCTNRQCIGDAYVGRMREIRDIMEGRWQPER